MLNLPYDAGHLGFLIHKKTKTTRATQSVAYLLA